jgi:hypothetical protein
MKDRSSSGRHPGVVVVVCSGRRRRVPQYGGHDDVPEIPSSTKAESILITVCQHSQVHRFGE